MKPARPKQETPAVMVAEVMLKLRRQWYAERPGDWFKDQNFLKKNVVLWLARELDRRGLTLPAARYFEILIAVLNTAYEHHQQTTFKYLPGFLMVCLQKHWKVNEQKYHDEAKSFSASVDAAIGKVQAAPAADPIRAMAAAQEMIVIRRDNRRHFDQAAQDLFSQ